MRGVTVAFLAIVASATLARAETDCYDWNCKFCTGSGYDATCTECDEGYHLNWGSCDYCGYGCKKCDGYSECTECYDGYHYDSYWNSCDYNYNTYHCDWGDDDDEDFYGRMMVGVIFGTIIAIILIIIASLPVCCGVMKEMNLCCCAVPLGIIAAICFFIPLISGMIVADQAVEDYCDRCEEAEHYTCTDKDKEDAKGLLGFWAIIVAYFHGGIIVAVLAGVAESLVCCMCCPCCGPLKAHKDARNNAVQPVGGNAVQGQVVGQPALK